MRTRVTDLGPGQPYNLSVEISYALDSTNPKLSRLDVELPGGEVLKVAVLDNPATLTRSGNSIVLVYDPARVIVFRQGAS